MEGLHCYSPRQGCDPAGLELPVHEYGHDARLLGHRRLRLPRQGPARARRRLPLRRLLQGHALVARARPGGARQRHGALRDPDVRQLLRRRRGRRALPLRPWQRRDLPDRRGAGGEKTIEGKGSPAAMAAGRVERRRLRPRQRSDLPDRRSAGGEKTIERKGSPAAMAAGRVERRRPPENLAGRCSRLTPPAPHPTPSMVFSPRALTGDRDSRLPLLQLAFLFQGGVTPIERA